MASGFVTKTKFQGKRVPCIRICDAASSFGGSRTDRCRLLRIAGFPSRPQAFVPVGEEGVANLLRAPAHENVYSCRERNDPAHAAVWKK